MQTQALLPTLLSNKQIWSVNEFLAADKRGFVFLNVINDYSCICAVHIGSYRGTNSLLGHLL